MHRNAIMAAERAAAEYSLCLAHKGLGNATSVVTASSGLAAVALLSNLCRQVNVFGLGHAKVDVGMKVSVQEMYELQCYA
eukprot:3124948-Pyramimonas_sp.AAC.2